jgi:hypothetical protein
LDTFPCLAQPLPTSPICTPGFKKIEMKKNLLFQRSKFLPYRVFSNKV